MQSIQTDHSLYHDCKLDSSGSQIRLISLQPASEAGEPLCCNIEQHKATDAPEYKALSYTWGEKKATAALSVQYESKTYELKITPSLEICLRHLRSTSTAHLLWIDQLCINQDDILERNQQVKLMHQIYGNAEKVIAWIGIMEHGSDILLQKLMQTAREAKAMNFESMVSIEALNDFVRRVLRTQPTRADYTPFGVFVTKVNSMFEDQVTALMHFSRRAWFRRIWVVQEVALAREVLIQCGSKTFEYELLSSGFSICQLSFLAFGEKLAEKISRMESKANPHNYKWQKKDDTISFFRLSRARDLAKKTLEPGYDGNEGRMLSYLILLNKSYRTEATDPRDKIFGILGLSSDTKSLGIEPDYNAAVNDIYTKTARAILVRGNGKNGPDTNILSYCRYQAERQLPSWAPDWRNEIHQGIWQQIDGDHMLLHYSAGGIPNAQPRIAETPDERVISVQGYSFDRIEELGSVWRPPQEEERLLLEELTTEEKFVVDFRHVVAIKELCGRALAKHKDAPPETLSRMSEAFWRVPCFDLADKPRTNSAMRANAAWKACYDTFMTHYRAFCGDEPIARGNAHVWIEALDINQRLGWDAKWTSYLKYVRLGANMRLFMTCSGYLGIAPAAAAVGDEVVVFTGAPVPYILRKVQDGKHELVGEAFCYMIMDGEAVKPGEEVEFLLV